MSAARNKFGVFLLAGAWAACLGEPPSSAAETTVAPTPGAARKLEFRRVFVPENRIGDVIRGEYVPYNSDEFEKLIEELLRTPGESPPAALATQAVYEARYDRQGAIAGKASLIVRQLSTQAATISLDGCNLAISKPAWDEQPLREARLGRTNKGNQVLHVERPGRLLFDWSSQGVTQANGDVEFQLALPKSTSARLVLSLPEGWMPTSPSAVIEELAPRDGLPTWNLVLGGAESVNLRLVRPPNEGQQYQAVVRNMNLTYSFDTTLVRLLAEVRFDVEHRPLEQISLLVSSPLQIRGAHLGDTELKFVTAQAASNQQIVTVEFPHPVYGIDRRLKLDAVLPPILESEWQLPTVKLLDALWQESRTSLELLSPVYLNRLRLSQCVQTSVKPLREPAGQIVELQHLTADAEITIWLGREPRRSSYQGGTTVRLLEDELRAAAVLDMTCTSGHQFEVDLDVPGPWIVDSVKASMSQKKEDLAGTSREETSVPLDWNMPAPGTALQKLHVSLKSAIRSDRIVQIRVQAHRPRPSLNETLSIEQLQVVTPRGISRVKHLVALFGQSPFRFELQSDKGITWIDRTRATPAERALISAEAGGLVFERDASAAGLHAFLTQGAARFTSSIEVRPLVQRESLLETFRIRCTPVHNARIERVEVVLSQTSQHDIHWSLEGEFVRAVTSRRLTLEEQRVAGIASSDDQSSIDVWEIVLARPRNVPFTLVGRRHSKSTDVSNLALVWVPKASSQDGRLILESDGDIHFDVEHTDLTPFPLASLPASGFTGERAAYRYRPVDLPLVRILRCQEEGTPVPAWAWSCQLTSRVSEAQAVHSACYKIECIGLGRMSLKLPGDAQLREVLVEGQPVNVSSTGDPAGGRITFGLPAGVHYTTVVVTYSDSQGLPWIVAGFKARLPEVSIPVLRHTWTLWVPPDVVCNESALSLENALPQDDLASRLLGPLVQRNRQTTTSAAGWRSWWKGAAEAADDSDRLRQVLNALSAARSEAETWSQLLTRYAELTEQENEYLPLPGLYVDQHSLQRLAITPATPLPRSEANRIEEVLDRAGLAVLLHDDRIVLVSQLLLATRRSAIRSLDNTPACRLVDAAKLVPALTTISVAQWLDSRARPPSPWSPSDDGGESELFHAGWSAVEFPIEPGKELTVNLVRSSRIRLFAWAAFFFFTGLGWWVAAVRPRRLFVPLLLSGAAAIAVPLSVSMIATAGFLGLVLGGTIGLIAGRIALRRVAFAPLGARRVGASRSAVATSQLLLILTIGAAATVCADDVILKKRTVLAAKKAGRIHAVVVPVDDKRRPVGDVVYLPRDFFEALLNLTANRDELARSWLIRAADYDCSLAWKGVGDELVAADLSATYQLDVIGKTTEVVLPLSREHLKVLPDRAMLNGKSVQVDWESDGDGLLLDTGRAGAHVLELSFRPMTKVVGQLQGLAIAVPRVLNTTLRVHLPTGTTRVELPNTLGAVDRSADRIVTAQLGPVDRLDIRWPASGTRDGDAAPVAVSQLSWLRVNQGSVIMRSKFRFSSRDGVLNEMAIKLDPRLQMRLSPNQPVAIVRETSSDDGITRTVYFRPIRRDETELTLEATFSVSDTSAVGNLPMPYVEAVADLTLRRWLAVSVAPVLQMDGVDASAVEPIEAHAFLTQWNANDQPPPDVTYLVKEPRRCRFVIRPRPTDVRATETLRLGIGNELASLQYRADLDVAMGRVFRVRFRVPEDLESTEVSLQAGGQTLPLTWVRTAADIVTVLAPEPLGPHSTLSISGNTRLPRRSNLAIPSVAIESIPVIEKRIELYRQPPVRLTLAPSKQWRTIPAAGLASPDPELGRIAAVLTPVSETSIAALDLPKISLQPNTPAPNYQLAIVARRIDGEWWADIDCRLHGFDGLVDTLRLDIPATWTQPFKAEGGTVNRIDTPGSNRSQLLVQWPNALTDATVVRLRGKLDGQPRELPDVRIADHLAKRTDRFVALQVKSVDQKTDWQTAGLRETPWPAVLSREIRLDADEFHFFRVVGQRYRAWVGNIGPVAGVPQIRLADVHVSYGTSRYFGIASFDLEPAGLDKCTLKLPPHTRLLHVSVAGHPAMTSALVQQQCGVHLSHKQLPQRIEVLYSGQWRSDSADGTDDPDFPLPHIVDVPVERTLVSFAGEGENAARQAQGAAVDGLRQELFRLRSMTTLIDLSRTIAKDQIPADKQRWYLPWARWMIASQRAIAGYRWRLSSEDNRLIHELADISNVQSEAADDLGTTGVFNEELNSSVAHPGLVDAAAASRTSTATVQRMIAKGRVPDVPLQASLDSGRWDWQRILTIGLFFIVAWTIYMLVTRGPLQEWFVHWPFVFGVIGGFFWWLYLQPSMAGWLIIIVSIAATLRSHGKRVVQ